MIFVPIALPRSYTNFILYPFVISTCSTNWLGHGHGYEWHSSDSALPFSPTDAEPLSRMCVCVCACVHSNMRIEKSRTGTSTDIKHCFVAARAIQVSCMLDINAATATTHAHAHETARVAPHVTSIWALIELEQEQEAQEEQEQEQEQMQTHNQENQ